MIVFDLRCGGAHVFEAWFGSTSDFDAQLARGLVTCPICGDPGVGKAAMAPAVPAKGNRAAALSPSEAKAFLAALAVAQAAVEATSDDVGARFAEEARAIHFGEAETRAIIGEASRAKAAGLAEDGISIAALPFPRRSRRHDA